MDYYLSHFESCNQEKVADEFTPRYLYDKDAVERIKKHLPNTKVIICIRNPTNRAISHVN